MRRTAVRHKTIALGVGVAVALGLTVAISAAAPAGAEPSESGISLTVSASPGTVTWAGEKIDYAFVVRNLSGSTSAIATSIQQKNFTGTATAPKITCPTTTIAPHTYEHCSASYITTIADLKARKISETVIAGARTQPTPGLSSETTGPITLTTAVKAGAQGPLVGNASPATATRAGEKVRFAFIVRDTTYADFTGTVVQQKNFTGRGVKPKTTCPTTTVLPGRYEHCSATYTVTSADLNSKKLTETVLLFANVRNPGDDAPSPAMQRTLTLNVTIKR